MAYTPHLLYMFDLVVDDLVIMRKNHCAPEEYPTCVEITFRNSVFVNLCDRDYGTCMCPGQKRNGKCCIFALESPVTKDDRLRIHVYKKRTHKCKFLIGLTEMEVKPLFDQVIKKFDTDNDDWLNKRQEIVMNLPRVRGSKTDILDGCPCFNPGYQRKEQLCPNSAMSKSILPLFNLCHEQTGNMVLLTRLVVHGPTIVSNFCKVGNKCVPVKRSLDQHPCYKRPEERTGAVKKAYRYFACNADKLCPCDICEDEFDRECPTVPSKKRFKGGVEFVKPCAKCAHIPLFPAFRSFDKLVGKKCKKNKNATKTKN